MQKVIVIIGPTAVGKTEAGLKLAKTLNTEIISGDSMQIYQEVAIGTAKPTKQEQAQIKHHLIDQRSVFQEYSVKDFVKQANEVIEVLNKKGKVPIVVGGTGFYINALVNKMQLGEPGEYKTSVDKKWEDFLEKNGPEKLWKELEKIDPAASEKIAPNNSRRTLRALTVIGRTGKLFSQQQKQITPRYDALIIGLNSERQLVYDRINRRVDLMMEKGLLDEAKFIYENRAQEHQVIQAIGYKELFPYFEGEKSLEECISKLKQASRKYAKRQITYFKHQLPVHWVDPLQDSTSETKIKKLVSDFLKV
ncbi:tRNA (adenosine(37)-N6)-dimethylallyltransferase MiaA [Lactobacillus sp. PV037]|uniref:tRNA (adenosine(37)-N6)-dimethylallyltransferase MiaA n=1 Tax=Lactobacillus sp. PV037 TaxID=2594496 RepID=UPI00223F2BF6|nr:tRNA (adenosine(37)-N6)-dimethylallyltransferase MiaA [Lactobacillus sp. PV037]QNQ83929.1 tRNA (adenosine(37)-N6)-dimethylallyltransferase MiaA [Lactobacillus sp. PV037]